MQYSSMQYIKQQMVHILYIQCVLYTCLLHGHKTYMRFRPHAFTILINSYIHRPTKGRTAKEGQLEVKFLLLF